MQTRPAALTTALALTASSLYAFQRDLEARGLADRVLTLLWSEFGRRAQQNASNGTDHGAAGTAFLIGARSAGHMIGEFPGLRHGLDVDGNVKPTVDFRGIYAALLEQWLGFDAASVLPEAGRFVRPGAAPRAGHPLDRRCGSIPPCLVAASGSASVLVNAAARVYDRAVPKSCIA